MAIEVKRSSMFRASDLSTLRLFREDYPAARCFLLYGGQRSYETDGVQVLPLGRALRDLPQLMA